MRRREGSRRWKNKEIRKYGERKKWNTKTDDNKMKTLGKIP